MRLDRLDDGIGSVLFFRRSARWRVAVVAQAIFPVKPVCRRVSPLERLWCAKEHPHARTAKLSGVESIARSLFDGDIPCNRCDGDHLDLGRAQRHDQRHSVVGGRICINQKWDIHVR